MTHRFSLPWLFFACFLTIHFGNAAHSQAISVTAYKNGFTNPIVIAHCKDDRLFVGERNGRIRVIDAGGSVLASPFLDITSKISSLNSEEGFLGMAFSPDYQTSGKFYVCYTDSIKFNESGGPLLYSVVEEYKVSSADPNLADASSALIIDTVNQPFQNHKGGNLVFGPDGYLYVGFGDGGDVGDPYGNGQNLSVKLGKILRFDVSQSSTANPYTVPPGNPFIGQSNVLPEIWAYGLRNPWRTSFDRITGDFWIADVGQDQHEEIDLQLAGVAGGQNYGWNRMEGTSCYNPPGGCDMSGITLPIYDYMHNVGACVIGGYVYRSVQSKELWGMYLFGDFVFPWIDGLQQNNGSLVPPVIRLNNDPGGRPISFGQDRYGELYVCFFQDGTIYKLEDANPNRLPKAYFTPIPQGVSTFLLQALQGKGFSYQWFLNGSAIPGATAPDFTASLPGTYTLQVTNSQGNSDLSDPFTNGALPITLVEFKARKLSSGFVELAWTTSSEFEMSGFYIQRSDNGPNAFYDLGFVASHAPGGNSTQTLHYSYTDATASTNTTLYYRLKIVDQDGHYTLSDIRIISIDGTSINKLTISPNPVRDNTTISWTGFIDASRLILRNIHGVQLGQYNVTGRSRHLNLQFLPKGVYIIQLVNAQGKILEQEKLLRD